ESLPYSFELDNIGKIMSKLVGAEFKQIEVLNFHLLNYIMDHSEYRNYYDSIIERLANGSKESVTFIDGFKERAINKAAFIQSISSK
ncbi:hypothetical protein, partial [Enterococcus faecalis]